MFQQTDDDGAGFSAAGEPVFQLGDGTWVLATHMMHELEIGPVPAGYHVVQTCGDNRCVNPAHFRLQKNTPRWERTHTSWHLRPA